MRKSNMESASEKMCINKPLIKSFLLLTIIFSLNIYSCDINYYEHQLETIHFSQADQNFEIVSFYRVMPVYIDKAKENRRAIDRLYKKYVFNPIWKDFASKGECSFLAENLKYPIKNLSELQKEIDVLSETGVEKIVRDALLKISKVLPGPNTTVYLQVIDPIYKQHIAKDLQTGVVAHTFGSGKIFITIDPTASNWKDYLLKIVAHEYHHSVWISRNFETTNFSLIEYITLEGRADSFADLIGETADMLKGYGGLKLIKANGPLAGTDREFYVYLQKQVKNFLEEYQDLYLACEAYRMQQGIVVGSPVNMHWQFWQEVASGIRAKKMR